MRLPAMDSSCENMKIINPFKKKKSKNPTSEDVVEPTPMEITDSLEESQNEEESSVSTDTDDPSETAMTEEETNDHAEVTVKEEVKPEPTLNERKGKGKKKRPKKKLELFDLIGKLIHWFWGAGPPTKFNCYENPFSAYSIRGKLKRWFYVHYRGYVYLVTTMYDKPNDVYLYDKDLVSRRDLPDDSVHVTNEKKTNHLDLDHPKRGFDATKDYGFTAHDAYMYIRCNKIDEAMKIELNEQSPIDYKKLLFIVIGVFVAFIVFYFMYMQR